MKAQNLMEAIPLCDKIEVYIYIFIYVYTQQYSTIVSNYNFLFSVWQHISAAHAEHEQPKHVAEVHQCHFVHSVWKQPFLTSQILLIAVQL